MKFDAIEWETDYISAAKRLCSDLHSQGKIVEENGAYSIRLGDDRTVALTRTDGASLYSSRFVTLLVLLHSSDFIVIDILLCKGEGCAINGH